MLLSVIWHEITNNIKKLMMLMAHGMWQCGVSHAQNSYWRWRCTIMGKKLWVIIYAKIWSKEMAKFLPNEKHQNQFQKSSEMVAPFGRFVRFNEGHKFEPKNQSPKHLTVGAQECVWLLGWWRWWWLLLSANLLLLQSQLWAKLSSSHGWRTHFFLFGSGGSGAWVMSLPLFFF